jgi:hypothetical protein
LYWLGLFGRPGGGWKRFIKAFAPVCGFYLKINQTVQKTRAPLYQLAAKVVRGNFHSRQYSPNKPTPRTARIVGWASKSGTKGGRKALTFFQICVAQQNQAPDGKGGKAKRKTDCCWAFENPETGFCLPTA